MASHKRLKKFQLFTAGVQSGTATITSKVIEIQYLDNVFLQLNSAGTASGAFDVQVSSDHVEDMEGNVVVAGNWISLVLSPSPVLVGASLNIGIDLNQLGASYLRVQYTNTSGTGVVDGFVSGKMLA